MVENSSFKRALSHLIEAGKLLRFEVFSITESSSKKDDKFIGFFITSKDNFNIEETELYLDKTIRSLTNTEGNGRG